MKSIAMLLLFWLGKLFGMHEKFASTSQLQKLNENNSIHQYTVNDIEGKPLPLSTFKGKVVIIVNVASQCGLTPQYESIQQFYDTYKSKNVVVLGFPANNFMGQEPSSNAEIQSFCSSKFNVTFPMFSKISVAGSDMHPLYQHLTQKAKNGVADSKVKWNFQKYIIDKNGMLIGHIAPTTKVTDAQFIKTVEGLL